MKSTSHLVDEPVHRLTPFGLKDGRFLAPDDVVSGLACGCRCPGCGALLVAKKGEKNAWHFAHHNVIAMETCVESAIHAAAKQVLLDENWLRVPEKRITVQGRTLSGSVEEMTELLKPSRVIRFDYSRAEVWEESIRPDVVGYKKDRRLLIEMFFTHRVDKAKRRTLEALGLPAIEIDLSHIGLTGGFEAVRQRVLHDTVGKGWLFYPGEKEAVDALRVKLDKRIEQHNFKHTARLAAIEARRRQAALARRALAEEDERYRALPRAEKERRLRKELGIVGPWPYYLNKEGPECRAIGEPPRIWQAALFATFIYGKAGSKRRLLFDPIREWVFERFGLVENRADAASVAIKLFLAYMRGCGFLEKVPAESIGSGARYEYVVVHGGLTPPTKRPGGDVKRNTSTNATTAQPEIRCPPFAQAEKERYWSWRASWPAKEEALAMASALSIAAPYKEPLTHMAQALSFEDRGRTPQDVADGLEAQGIPVDITIEFLVELGFVLEGYRSSS